MQSFEELIHFAIRHEEAEAAFYEQLADRSQGADQKKALMDHADEERDHKRRLEEILANQRMPSGASADYTAPADMQFQDYLKPRDEKEGALDYEDALLHAAKREREAERFYRDLAAQVGNPGLRKSILFLAEQEGKHANQLERELDDSLKEN